MTELTPFFEFLRIAFIVTGIIGALEIVVFVVIVLLHMSRPYVRYLREGRHDG